MNYNKEKGLTTDKYKMTCHLRPARILAILPMLLATKASLSSQTMKSIAAMRDENFKNGASSSSPDSVSFVWKLGKSALRGAKVSYPPYISPEAT